MSELWLGVDTATDAIGVGIWDGARILDEATWVTRRGHTVQLAPAVEAALGRHALTMGDVTGIAVTVGPGSYTGLRVGLAFAKGVAAAMPMRVVAVPTLDVLAAPLSPPDVSRTETLWAVLSAGRGRVIAVPYPPDESAWPSPAGLEPGRLEDRAAHATTGDWIAGELTDDGRGWAAGRGLRVCSVAASTRRAGWLAQLGARRHTDAAVTAEAVAALEPVYPKSRDE